MKLFLLFVYFFTLACQILKKTCPALPFGNPIDHHQNHHQDVSTARLCDNPVKYFTVKKFASLAIISQNPGFIKIQVLELVYIVLYRSSYSVTVGVRVSVECYFTLFDQLGKPTNKFLDHSRRNKIHQHASLTMHTTFHFYYYTVM
jgi:hypothetical protein